MATDGSEVSRVRLILAFGVIYILWGSTYLAIRVAVETLPPFLMAGVRFLIAGSILYAYSRNGEAPRPTRRQWRNAVLASIPLFVVGNGGVTYAEQTVPSGLAALVVATLPAWLLLLDWSYGGRRGPRVMEVAGIVLGLVGVFVLAAPSGAESIPLLGTLLLVGSSIGWAAGSLVVRYSDLPKAPACTSGMQMLAGGALMVAIGLALGEANRFDVARVTWESATAVVYLIAVALIAVPSYTWLLTVTSPALVGTYAFVNPVVAVFLGWAAGETLSERTGLAAVLVVTGVVLLIRAPASSRRIVSQTHSLPDNLPARKTQ
jgi:drug/metabolite transporter (DMT)-like permease